MDTCVFYDLSKFESQISGYKQDSKFEIRCSVKTA